MSTPARRLFASLLTIAPLVVLAAPLAAQAPLPKPWASPRARVNQVIGISEVTIDYGRPAVKGREIWGGLVPWGEVWRAGANENTTIEITHDATIEGQPLAAGVYGLHVLPREDGMTLIFSRNASSWGSFTYDAAEDALRVEVKAVEAPHQEWLAYEFDELAAGSALCRLRWAKLAIPFRVGFDTPAIVLANARDAYLRDLPGFSWQGWANAARYCLQSGKSLEEGLAWAQRSVSMNATYTNLTLVADLHEKLGHADEAKVARAKALPLATETDMNTLGYERLQAGRIDEALAIFEENTRRYPDSWNTWDSLAEGLLAKGDKAKAREYYGKALSMVRDDAQNRARIEKALEGLGEG